MARKKNGDGDDAWSEPNNGKQRQVRRRQQEILDAAAAIFNEKGYEATSTQDIAEAVGLLKGSLYYYIDSKEDLLFAIINDAHQGALESLEVMRAVPGDALEKIRVLIETHLRYFTDNRIKTAVFFRDFRSLSEEKQKIIAGEGDEYLRELRMLISRGQDEGVVAPDIDPRMTSIGIIGMLNSLSQWYDPGGSHSPEEISAAFGRLVIGGLASDEAVARAGGRLPFGRSVTAGSGSATAKAGSATAKAPARKAPARKAPVRSAKPPRGGTSSS